MKNQIFLIFLGFLLSGTLFSQDSISGAEVYSLNCARCHQARPTYEFSDREWDVIVPHMRERAHLTKTESNALTVFLQQSNLPETIVFASALPPMPTGQALDGATLVTQFACVGCHVINKKGGVIGPSLDDVFTRRDEAFMHKKLTNPQFNNPASPMPRFPLTQEQKDAIVNYLKTIK